MSEQYITPPVNSAGVINLKEPFQGLCAANVSYKIAEVRSFPGIIANGQDPFALYYEPNGISQATFNEHVESGVCILTLSSPSGEVVHVPNAYLVTAPVATGVPYANVGVGVRLGAVPETLSLTYFTEQVKVLAHDLLGVTDVEVKSMLMSPPTYISLADSKLLEAARAQIMHTVVTDAARLRISEQERLKAIQKIAELEAYIRAHP